MKIVKSIPLLLLSLVLLGCVPLANARDAENALRTYFALLNESRYTEAVMYYGGDWATLRDWNPDVPTDDYATLLQRACEFNGLVCIKVGKILGVERIPDGFRFRVEFVWDDGSTFVLGPCCGADESEMPPQQEFAYTVIGTDNRFLIQELPVYVP